MRQFTTEEIQKKFETLPQEVQDAVTSPEVHDSLIAISKKYNLLLDQEAELVDQVGLVMLGFSPSKDFVKKFSSEAEIDPKTAQKIATDINEEIFGKIRTSMRKIEENEQAAQDQAAISDLEKAGDFTIEPSEGSGHMGETNEALPSTSDLITGIEHPEAINTHTDLLVDHLLAGPSVAIEQKIEQKPPVVATPGPQVAPQQPPKKTGPDLYREPVE